MAADCPTPTRVRYASEGRAWASARLFPGRVPYRCGDHWHLAPRAEAMRHRTAGR